MQPTPKTQHTRSRTRKPELRSAFGVSHRQRVFHGWNGFRCREDHDHVISACGKGQNEHAGDMALGSDLRRYVTFYFTNFPAQLSIFYLRKGFEVCGILEDVYVAKKRNRFGEPYGFVKFSNVKDVTKLTKALNVVWFGHFRVCASVAKFERSDTGAGRRLEDGQAGKMEGDGDPSKQGKAGHK
ncbi:heterogeneous nuclear ribonucleoprotein A0 [Trifolium repens]|nr:heterogeneous nuclear ribonucleoprotein A0 [Trifolium repens]